MCKVFVLCLCGLYLLVNKPFVGFSLNLVLGFFRKLPSKHKLLCTKTHSVAVTLLLRMLMKFYQKVHTSGLM
jgi:hypothetical protein